MNFKIKNDEIREFNNTASQTFPKYTSQLINLACQTSQATRAKVVGQMSDLFPMFLSSTDEVLVEDWKEYYLDGHPDSLEKATDKICEKIELMKKAILLIDRDMVNNWVEDLVINKTYNGMYVQHIILSKIAEREGLSYRLGTTEEEAKGIDGYVGDTPYSIKPESYKSMGRLSEEINVKMVYYKKTKTGLTIEVED